MYIDDSRKGLDAEVLVYHVADEDLGIARSLADRGHTEYG